ncbi:hypothetical protein BH09BAC1_BH09BAC1_21950 [soil metagenome]
MENPEEQKVLSKEELRKLALIMQHEGYSRAQIHQALCNEGLDGWAATKLLDSIEPTLVKATTNDASRDMVIGGAWCVGGMVITLITYSMSSGGGTYIVAWGAILFGAVQFINGFMASRKNQ